jgi:hypothetical protein
LLTVESRSVPPDHNRGRCHRRAPVAGHGWPVTEGDSGCGEHKPAALVAAGEMEHLTESLLPELKGNEVMDTEVLQERADVSGSRVDAANGIIRGVKLLGLVSKNGREYTPEALRGAAEHYANRPINIDHGDGRRSYKDRIGRVLSAECRADGLYGSIQLNPKHPLTEQLLWDAEHSPQSVGLSHDAVGRTVRRDGKTIVEKIESVRSVDLVADPATTGGLFESANGYMSSERPALAAAARAMAQAATTIAGREKAASAAASAEHRTLRERVLDWGDGMPGACPPAAASENRTPLHEATARWRFGDLHAVKSMATLDEVLERHELPVRTGGGRHDLSAIVAGWRN